MRKTLLIVVAAGFFGICATADPISVPYSTSDTSLSFLFPDGGGDTLTMTGQNGLVALATEAVTTASIFNSSYTTVSTTGTGVRTFDLTYNLTVDGVTHTMTQPVVWT